MIDTKFNSILIIGIGLIGSSLARAIKENDLAKNIQIILKNATS
jgi:prephenate dehydrogenase